MSKIIHPIAGALAFLMILTFWVSTVVSELFGSVGAVVTVKTLIPLGLIVLVPVLMAAGGSGFYLAKGWRNKLANAKRKRMPVIGAIGALVLIPSALFLSSKAQAGEFDTVFYSVQIVELLAGAVNIVLLGLNMRDGLRMKGRLRPRPA